MGNREKRPLRRKHLKRCFAWVVLPGFLGFSLCFYLTAHAQQTIFNVPSADITDKSKIYMEQESQFRPWEHHAYWLGAEYAAYGVGHNSEIDLTLYNVSAPHSGNISLGAGFKSAIPLFKGEFPEEEFKATIGTQIVPSLQDHGCGVWTYGHLSGRIPGLKTRLTAGISGGTHQLFGRNTIHFIGGVEQPVTKNFALIADWFSGTQSEGWFTSGFSYTFQKSQTSVFAGYQIPNSLRVGHSGFTIEVAKFF